MDDPPSLKHMYDQLGYFDQYSASVLLFVVITTVTLVIVAYCFVMANAQPIIDDWPNQRCKPYILPIAGWITRPEGVSAGDYTAENFTYCTQSILSNIGGYAIEPLTYVTHSLQSVANNVQDAIQSSRAMFDKVRTSMQSVSQEIMGRLMNVMVPLIQMIASVKDMTSKIQGSMTAGVYTLLGSYFTFKSLLGAIAQFIISILVALSVMIAMFWAVPFTWGAAIANTSIFVAISIPLAIILSFMSKVMHIDGGFKIPKIKCFDASTPIPMANGTTVPISEVRVGHTMANGDKITAKIKVITEGSVMYRLGELIVSDSHKVQHEGRWIPVRFHPEAVRLKGYKEPYLYCLNTSSKQLCLGGYVFTDWDELYDDSLTHVMRNAEVDRLDDLHCKLDTGFHPDTPVILSNKEVRTISTVSIRDCLAKGGMVYGVVEIDGEDVAEYGVYSLANCCLVEGALPAMSSSLELSKPKREKLYHLLTTQRRFYLGSVAFPDYNHAIDRFV